MADANALAQRLYATTDAAVWTEEFLTVIGGPDAPAIDFGLMVCWFANAIETGRANPHPDAAFTEGGAG